MFDCAFHIFATDLSCSLSQKLKKNSALCNCPVSTFGSNTGTDEAGIPVPRQHITVLHHKSVYATYSTNHLIDCSTNTYSTNTYSTNTLPKSTRNIPLFRCVPKEKQFPPPPMIKSMCERLVSS